MTSMIEPGHSPAAAPQASALTDALDGAMSVLSREILSVLDQRNARWAPLVGSQLECRHVNLQVDQDSFLCFTQYRSAQSDKSATKLEVLNAASRMSYMFLHNPEDIVSPARYLGGGITSRTNGSFAYKARKELIDIYGEGDPIGTRNLTEAALHFAQVITARAASLKEENPWVSLKPLD